MEWLVKWQGQTDLQFRVPDDFSPGIPAVCEHQKTQLRLTFDSFRDVFIVEEQGIERIYRLAQNVDSPGLLGMGPEEAYLHCLNGPLLHGLVESTISGLPSRKAEASQSPELIIHSPLVGSVLKVAKKSGDAVLPGETVVVIEAMKMENQIKSPIKGTLKKLAVKAGGAIALGETICVIERV